MLLVSRFPNLLCVGSDDGSSSNKSGGWNVSKLYCQYIAESSETETHLSIKFLKKDFGGILRPKSVRRTLVIGLIYEPRGNKQSDIAFSEHQKRIQKEHGSLGYCFVLFRNINYLL